MRAETLSKKQDENQATTNSIGDSFGDCFVRPASHLQDEALAGNMPKRLIPDWAKNISWGVDAKRAGVAATSAISNQGQ